MTPQQQLAAARSHHQAGRLAEAERIYRQILTDNPGDVEALNLLGAIAAQSGHTASAIEIFREVIRAKPKFPGAYYNLGLCLQKAGQFKEAVQAYQNAVRLKPDYLDALNNLGNALMEAGGRDEAIAVYENLTRLHPNYANGHYNFAVALFAAIRLDQSIEQYFRLLAIQPDFPGAHANLALALHIASKMDEAVLHARRSAEREPDNAMGWATLAGILRDAGETVEAIAAYRRSILIDPRNPAIHSKMIVAMYCDPDSGNQTIREEISRWNTIHVQPHAKSAQRHKNDRDPDRRLRIGYVSPDLRQHVVGENLLPILSEHDHRQFEIFCYSSTSRPDQLTGQIRSSTDKWRDAATSTDEQLAETIRRDQIDLLVDLSLHAGGNRLLMMAQKPAPVQVCYLSYPGTTGVVAIDYRLSDPYLDPTDADFQFYSEQTVRLPETYWCYRPRGATPEPFPRPAVATGYVTFGCLNNFGKISRQAQDVWARIMRELSDSRLIVHAPEGGHREIMRQRFVAAGISGDRLQFVPEMPWAQYCQTHAQIDISLDPFPWGGGITTCNALWMGVPVVTLIGQTAVGRGGASILSNIGLPDLIAATADRYIEIATDLARDLSRLSELSDSLRRRMHKSPLMDARRFTKNIESSYRKMWHSWCGKRMVDT